VPTASVENRVRRNGSAGVKGGGVVGSLDMAG